MHLNSELLFKKYGLSYFSDDKMILEIGPSGIPSVYNKIINKPNILWDTLDIGHHYQGLTYVSENEYKYPIPDNSYDIILSGQVMEHVKHIWRWFNELKRIVKKDGIIIIISPISWPYHEAPDDCWRIYPEGMKALCEEVGLKVQTCIWESLENELLMNNPTYPGMSFNYLNKPIFIKYVLKWNRILRVIPSFKKLQVPLPIAYDMITVISK